MCLIMLIVLIFWYFWPRFGDIRLYFHANTAEEEEFPLVLHWKWHLRNSTAARICRHKAPVTLYNPYTLEQFWLAVPEKSADNLFCGLSWATGTYELLLSSFKWHFSTQGETQTKFHPRNISEIRTARYHQSLWPFLGYTGCSGKAH